MLLGAGYTWDTAFGDAVMNAPSTPNLTAEALRQSRFKLLEDLAKEMNEQLVFPTSLQYAARLNALMNREDTAMPQMAKAIEQDPLVATKLIRLANSAAYGAGVAPVAGVGHALQRVGLTMAKSIALTCALEQLAQSGACAPFADDMQRLYEHSLKTAVYARVLAKNLTKCSPEAAFLAGLVHDLGAFFMFSRVPRYLDLVERPETARFLVAQWHESIGAILLDSLGLPKEVLEACIEVDTPRKALIMLRTLQDVLYVANLLCGGYEEMQRMEWPELMPPDGVVNFEIGQCLLECESAWQQLQGDW